MEVLGVGQENWNRGILISVTDLKRSKIRDSTSTGEQLIGLLESFGD